MNCEEKIGLTNKYSQATLAFSQAVAELHRKAGTSGTEEFARLQRATDEMRVKCEQARLALERHTATHRC